MDVRKVIIGLTLSLLLGNGVAAGSAEDDFMAGWRIYFALNVDNKDATNEDYKPAVKLLKSAALQGHSGAQSLLGGFYRTGQGVLENDKTAVKWIILAAKQGDGNSQYSLGEMYKAGEGVEQDYIKAYMWFNLADHAGTKIFNWGDELGKTEPQEQEKRELVSVMTTDDINKAQLMSSRCLASNYTDC